MAKVVIDTKIPDLITSWENYTGQRVEELIKEYLNSHETSITNLEKDKYGWVAIIQAQDTKYYHLYFFKDRETYITWSGLPDDDETKAELVLRDIEIPLVNDTGIQDIITLTRETPASIAVSKPEASATLTYKWEQFNPVNQSTTLMDEDAIITVSVRLQQGNGTWGSWIKEKEFSVPTTSGAPRKIDLSQLLTSDGTYQVRFIATGDNSSHISSPVTMTILYTNIKFEYMGDISAVLSGNNLSLPFRITGNTPRGFNLRINNFTYTDNAILGSTPYDENLFQFNFNISTFYPEGATRNVISAEAWITFGDNFSFETEKIKFQFIYIPSGDTSEVPILAVSDVKGSITNWSYNTAFKYAIYNPVENITPLKIRLIDRDTSTTYTEQTVEVQNGVVYEYLENFAIESNTTSINGQFQFYNSEGLSFDNNINITIDNSDNFSSTSGATFILQPDKKLIKAGENTWTYEECIEDLIDTNSGWGSTLETDSFGTKISIPTLRVGAGNLLTIPYKIFDENTGLYRSGIEGSTTVEFDIRVSNIVDDSNPIIDISVPYGEQYVGIRMYPTQIVCLDRVNNKPSLCDVGFQEDTREHIAVNIIRNLRNSGINYVRIYINGRCNREFVYEIPSSDTTPSPFVQLTSDNDIYGAQSIKIGSPDADIEIFGMRVYKGGSLSSIQIQNDYMSSMPTIEDKKQFKLFNSIYNGSTIEYQTCLGMGYNCILRKLPADGHYPSKLQPDKQKNVEIEVRIFDEKGNPDSLDKVHSGNFYGMTIKGQGTSAKGYYWWNISDGFEDDKEIDASEYNPSNPTHYEEDGAYYKKVSYFVSVDEESQYYTSDYEIEPGRGGITKLTGKANYASMQQSHKLGNIWMYDELWQALVNNGSNGRPILPGHACCYEKPFLAFYQIGEETPVFCGFQTWGSSKGDKKTFGYDKKKSPGYMCVSGADNGSILALYQIPIIMQEQPNGLWSGNISYQQVTINTGDKKNGYCYKEGESYNLSFEVEIANKYDGGETDIENYVRGEDELKGDSERTFMVDFAKFTQFVCASSPLLQSWNGTVQSLKDTDPKSLRTDYQYWIAANGVDKYKVFYYNPTTGVFEEINFIPDFGNEVEGGDGRHVGLKTATITDQLSGITVPVKTTNGEQQKPILEAIAGTSDPILQTEYLSKARVNYFIAHADKYIDIDDCIFHQCWVKLEAGTDNRTKNTYPWIDGTIDKLVRLKQDDMDTVKNTDNQGQLTKPYHILEHTKDPNGTNYWNGENNVFFTLLERAYPDRMRNMMNRMFTQMSQIAGSVFQYYEDRFYWVQRYFPAVAYNETIRLLYEKAKDLVVAGTLTVSQDPISQAIGDQLESEQEYMNKRIPMLMSWCQYETYQGSGALTFRSVSPVGSAENTKPTYNVEYTAYQYIYPKLAIGGNIASIQYQEKDENGVRGGAWKTNTGEPYRCEPGETVKMSLTTDSNTQFTLQWMNYAKSIGNLGILPCKEEGNVSIVGKRLRALEIKSPDNIPNEFNPQGLTLNCRNLESIDLTNATFSGEFNFDLPRCKTIKLKGTKYTQITPPKTSALEYLSIPTSLYGMEISAQPNLETLDYTNLNQIQSLKITGKHKLSDKTYQIVSKLMEDGATPTNLTIYGLDWTIDNGITVNPSVIDYSFRVRNCDLQGTIQFYDRDHMTYQRKVDYTSKWGNIDDPENPLYFEYPYDESRNKVHGMSITGQKHIYQTGTYKYNMFPLLSTGSTATYGNDFIKIEWKYSGYGSSTGDNTIDPKTGILTVTSYGDHESSDFDGTITCIMTKKDGSTLSKDYPIHLNYRDARVGDYLFADGTFSDENNPNKTVVGICFYVNEDNPDERLAVGTKTLGGHYWGLFDSPSEMAGIKLDAGAVTEEKQIYDLPNLPNIGGGGVTTSTGASSYRLNPDTYWVVDEETSIGDFKDYKSIVNDTGTYHTDENNNNGKAASMFGFVKLNKDLEVDEDCRWAVRGTNNTWIIPSGTSIPWGFIQTRHIINHRNDILKYVITESHTDKDTGDLIVDAAGLPIPEDGVIINGEEKTEYESLLLYMDDVANKFKNAYKQIYFPAASIAYAYNPATHSTIELKDGETLNPRLGLHNWFLPSIGDLARMYWYHSMGNSSEPVDPRQIYKMPIAQLLFDTFPSSIHWSSTENSSKYSWGVNFYDGSIYGTSLYLNGYSKNNHQNVVRPVVAF